MLAAKSWLQGRAANNEGPCIGKKDLRQVQGHHPQGSSPGDLRKRKAQAAPGLGGTGKRGSFQERVQGPGFRDQIKHDRASTVKTEPCPLNPDPSYKEAS